MNKTYLSSLTFLAASLLLTSCASDPPNIERIGLTPIIYDTNKLSDNKYTLEASTGQAVTSDELLAAYKRRAASLCAPKIPHLNYKTSMESYMSTVGKFSLPASAPKISGIVTCE